MAAWEALLFTHTTHLHSLPPRVESGGLQRLSWAKTMTHGAVSLRLGSKRWPVTSYR